CLLAIPISFSILLFSANSIHFDIGQSFYQFLLTYAERQKIIYWSWILTNLLSETDCLMRCPGIHSTFHQSNSIFFSSHHTQVHPCNKFFRTYTLVEPCFRSHSIDNSVHLLS